MTEIDKLKEQLAVAQKDLDEFIYLASHDLKAPLNAIDNLASWLTEDLGTDIDEDSLKHIGMIRSRASRAKLLVDDLLQYSRVGREIDEYEMFSFHEAISQCAAQADANTFKLTADPGGVILPKHSFNVVFTQLISNVVKHHHIGKGDITVTCEKLACSYRIKLEDDGPGIAPAFHEKIFKKFHTLKSRDEVEGSGMGLAIVEKTLGLFDGKISVESDGNSGTTFIVDWPMG